MIPNHHILIIGHTWPEPNTTAAGVRMLQLIELFLEQQWTITFAATADKTPYSENLKARGIEEVDIQLNDSNFDSFVTKLNPDIVVFDRFLTEEQFGWRVREHCPNALCVLDTEDLHFLRSYRQQNSSETIDERIYEADLTKREIASIYRCDVSLIISEVEKELLETTFHIPSSILQYTPLFISEMTLETIQSFENRQHFVFFGNFLHKPNVDAVLYLYTELWPSVKKQLPDAEIHIYGAYAPKQILQLHNPKKGFVIKGWVLDLDDALNRYRVLLAPLRFGAGLKGKLIKAMTYGLPFVTTPIGAEGILSKEEYRNSVATPTEKIAKYTIELYKTPSLWTLKQKEGFQLVKERFDKSQHQEALLEKLKTVSDNLKQHRHQNFIGSLLNHHHHLSVKYLAKWIEAKNK